MVTNPFCSEIVSGGSNVGAVINRPPNCDGTAYGRMVSAPTPPQATERHYTDFRLFLFIFSFNSPLTNPFWGGTLFKSKCVDEEAFPLVGRESLAAVEAGCGWGTGIPPRSSVRGAYHRSAIKARLFMKSHKR